MRLRCVWAVDHKGLKFLETNISPLNPTSMLALPSDKPHTLLKILSHDRMIDEFVSCGRTGNI